MRTHIWPKIFTNPSMIKGRNKVELLGDCLAAWAAVMEQNEMPENFSEVMVKAGNEMGFAAVPANCEKAFEQWVAAGKPINFKFNI